MLWRFPFCAIITVLCHTVYSLEIRVREMNGKSQKIPGRGSPACGPRVFKSRCGGDAKFSLPTSSSQAKPLRSKPCKPRTIRPLLRVRPALDRSTVHCPAAEASISQAALLWYGVICSRGNQGTSSRQRPLVCGVMSYHGGPLQPGGALLWRDPYPFSRVSFT